MTLQYKRRSGAVALTTAIALFMAPIASAQTVDSASVSSTAIKTLPMSREAFGNLTGTSRTRQPNAVEASVSEKPSLLRQATAAVQTSGHATPAQAQQKSWVSRHKHSIIFTSIFLAALVVVVGVSTNWGDD